MSPERKTAVISNVRSTIAAYMMYWHKLCLEISILISSGIVAVVTFGVDRASLSPSGRIALILCTGLAVLFGIRLVIYAASLLQDFRKILARADEHDGLFDINAYIPGDSIYPTKWQTSDTMKMDTIPKGAIVLMVITWLVLSFFIIIAK